MSILRSHNRGWSLSAAFLVYLLSVPAAFADGLDIDVPTATGQPNIQQPRPKPTPPLKPDGSLKLFAAVPERLCYAAGDTIVLDLVTGLESAIVEVDFSSLDSGYERGDEEVENLGNGRFLVAYDLTRENVRQAGDYDIAVTLRDSNRRRSYEDAFHVTYLPRGGGMVQLPAGRFLATEWTALDPSGVQVLAEVVQPNPNQEPEDFQLRNKVDLALTLLSAEPLTGNVELEVRQRNTDGHWQVPLTLGDSNCGLGGCSTTAMVEVATNASPAPGTTTLDLVDLELRVVTNGSASPIHAVPAVKLSAGPLNHTHRVSGTIRFRYKRRFPDIAASMGNADYPQYASVDDMTSVRPVRWAKIVLEDDCGHYITSATDSHGNYAIDWTPVGCFVGQITVWTVTDSGQRRVGVGSWKHGPVDSINQLTTLTQDYLAYSDTTSFLVLGADLGAGGLDLDIDVSELSVQARGFLIMDQFQTAQNYYHDIQGVSTLPRLNGIYSPGLKPDDIPGNMWDGRWAQYLPSKDPGFILIPAEPTDYGWNRFSHLHETSHYFQHHYLRNDNYGRIGEPLANAMAAAIAGDHWFDKASSFENLDVQANFKNGDFQQADWSFCESCDTLDYSSGWVQRVIWDLIDDTSAAEPEPLTSYIAQGGGSPVEFGQFDQDNGGGGHNKSTDADNHQINDVLVNYLGGGEQGSTSPDYVDRGIEKVDVVDLLDGMLCRGHASESAIDELVNDAMAFGYDFDGPASCD